MFKLNSKHRSAVMGVAAIIIVVHHYMTNVIGEPYKFGAIGVDMFMFTMGIGLYFSLYNGTEKKGFFKNLPSFYLKRFKRIVPVFALFLVAWGMWKYSNGGLTVKEFLLNLSFTGYWTLPYSKYFNWFISGILLFYIVSPFLFIAFKNIKRKYIPLTVLFIVLSFLVYLMRKDENGEITRTLIMVVRLIPLCFGMLFGAYCKDEPSKKEKCVVFSAFVLLFILGVVLYVMNNKTWNDTGFTYGMPWYSFGLMTPFVCTSISLLIDVLSRFIKWIDVPFNFFGKMSFEIYLTHIFVIENILVVLKRKNALWFDEPKNFIAAMLISTISAYVLYLFTEKISNIKLKKNNM